MFAKLIEQFLRFARYIKWLYFMYELNTQISICEPWEKVFCNILLGSCVSIILYASIAFVPGYCVTFSKLLLPAVSVLSNSTS